ncbi:MAG: class I SAM-dependent methyltransferase, partial [Thermoplasmata archaeon]|nr:class I SAM-dependent methyltransferase [Thermoplasmata archaeon]
MTNGERTVAFGQNGALSALDRLGTWLSAHKLEALVGAVDGKRVGDFGAGYEARTARRLAGRAAETVVVDLALADDLSALPGVRAIEGRLPAVMTAIADGSIDVALAVSVLEHLDEPDAMLSELHRVLAPGGVLFVNVPSWAGKRLLEFSAFRLGLTTRPTTTRGTFGRCSSAPVSSPTTSAADVTSSGSTPTPSAASERRERPGRTTRPPVPDGQRQPRSGGRAPRGVLSRDPRHRRPRHDRRRRVEPR